MKSPTFAQLRALQVLVDAGPQYLHKIDHYAVRRSWPSVKSRTLALLKAAGHAEETEGKWSVTASGRAELRAARRIS